MNVDRNSGPSADDLRRLTEQALAELRTFDDHDPVARRAMRAVRLTIHTLEEVWLPALPPSDGMPQKI